MKKILLLLICFLILSSRAVNAQQEVMTWVAPYFINDSKTVLESSYGGIPVKSTLTRIGLQFWKISSKGSVSLLSDRSAQVNDTQVRWFADWGKQNNIKILLTVVNDGGPEYGYNSFDWRLVRAACYGSHGDILITNLLAEVDKYDLSGIDLDLEGEDAHGPYTEDDNLKYSVFVNNLCDSLHARGKICTIDSYSETEYGAPRSSWWSSWKGKIDAIHTMGYTSEYWSNPAGNSYQNLQKIAINAGIEPRKLLFGMPMWVDNWAGTNSNIGRSNTENLNYILNCLEHQTGITLWDIHAPADVIKGTQIHPWTADAVWQLLKAIHDGQESDISLCPSTNPSGKVIDDMSNIGVNLKGGVWSAFSDNWSRTSSDQSNSTRVMTLDRNYDMALQFGTYGDIGPGYTADPLTGQEIKSIIKTYSKAGTNPAEGGFMMNFMPVDRSLDPTAESWEITKVGVERDLSAFNKLVVGAQGTAGKKIRIYIVSKAQLSSGTAGYGSYFTCSGSYENFELTFASLKPIWGSGATGFDATHALRLIIEYVDPAPPGELTLKIAGVALDTSVLNIKHHMDCNGDIGGSATLDICGNCVVGNTGKDAETNPCNCPATKLEIMHNIKACGDYTSPSGKYIWTETGIYRDTITSLKGCDSLLLINLKIGENSTSFYTVSACDSYGSPSGKYIWSASGSYTDTIPNYSGCDSIIAINLEIGKNSKNTIYPVACGSYTSLDGKTPWTKSGIYTDTIPNAIGCDSIITVKLTVKKVDVSVSQNGRTITAGATIGLYRWFLCGEQFTLIEDATNRSFTPTSQGEYAVEITQNGCVDTSECKQVTVTGIEQNSFDGKLRIFPNPASGNIRILLPETELRLEVELKNVLGQSFLKEVFLQKREIELSFNVPGGLYFLLIRNSQQQQQVVKLVIK